MVISTRIICLPSIWEEMLVRYTRLKHELGLDFKKECCPDIYWKDNRLVIFEESFNAPTTIEDLNKCFITFCETIGNPQLGMNDNSFEGSIYSSIPEMLCGNSKAFINFYGEVE